ncbi:hypothetical protein ASF61_18185 [Duganella sp. Leaf126]|uniref:NF038129 family PEP-CTERM protein n=1 Tax=Duganella sp. Leaf126 TaxID=1736266 RepID=UPI000700BA50|nr:NF038129 family PEP-CTERM protein [Duganella sp. Leaf126]KQQ46331.1 hypothetical protein ASF61_18185 [Duganella sp. Leaf126]
MFNPTLTSLRRAALVLALSACAGLASAASAFHIELDTAALAATHGNSGWIDLQFNPGNSGTPYAQAQLSHFSGFGDPSTAVTAGNVSGSLAGAYVIGNNDAGGYNDLFHAVNFGSKVGFTVTFSGELDPSLSAFGSTFGVSLFDRSGTVALGAGAASDALVLLTWTSLGSATSVPLANQIGTTVNAVSAVPEPQGWLMLGAGLALLGAIARRRRQQG